MQALLTDVFAAWREAEAMAQSAPPGSPAQTRAFDAAERLKALYHDIEAASHLGVHDRGAFAAMFEEMRLRPG